jgi:hypothetical protein
MEPPTGDLGHAGDVRDFGGGGVPGKISEAQLAVAVVSPRLIRRVRVGRKKRKEEKVKGRKGTKGRKGRKRREGKGRGGLGRVGCSTYHE